MFDLRSSFLFVFQSDDILPNLTLADIFPRSQHTVRLKWQICAQLVSEPLSVERRLPMTLVLRVSGAIMNIPKHTEGNATRTAGLMIRCVASEQGIPSWYSFLRVPSHKKSHFQWL